MLNLHSMIWPKLNHSIANSSLFPTSLYLHSNFSPKKMVFLKKKIFHPKKIFFNLFSMQLFSADAMVFDPEKVKKWASKLLKIGPDPFISQSSPYQWPTAQN